MASGILIYMGLVDLLATDIFSAHMRSQRTWFQVGCLVAVALGATAMVRLGRYPQASWASTRPCRYLHAVYDAGRLVNDEFHVGCAVVQAVLAIWA
jgi:hypothetical protein